MAHIARGISPGILHRVAQRSNRLQQTFFCVDAYRAYLFLMSEWCNECGVEICRRQGDHRATVV